MAMREPLIVRAFFAIGTPLIVVAAAAMCATVLIAIYHAIY